MRIAQIAPLFERVPPRLYGGTERVVWALTEELVNLGHEVTLFASADSISSARLVPMAETGIRLGGARDANALHVAMLDEVYQQADQFDIFHAHVDVLAFPFARQSQIPTLHTMHGRLDLPEQRRVLARFADQRLVSISHNQRDPVRQIPINWQGTVYNGVRLENFTFQARPDASPYLVFLGRISPEKGPTTAIEIARRAGVPLKIAAKIDPADEEWAKRHFLPLLDTPGIEYLGEVDEERKLALLGGARALLFPIDWPEPFGMVQVEAMACGTPVLAFARGSVGEVIVHGETGYIGQDLDELVDAVSMVDRLDRASCRQLVAERFSSATMARRYEAIYQRIVDHDRPLYPDDALVAQPLRLDVLDGNGAVAEVLDPLGS